MKATQPGPVIGIAMENFEENRQHTVDSKQGKEGRILVFLANGEGNLAANLLKAQDKIKTLKEDLEELRLEFSKLKSEPTKTVGQAEGGK